VRKCKETRGRITISAIATRTRSSMCRYRYTRMKSLESFQICKSMITSEARNRRAPIITMSRGCNHLILTTILRGMGS
jgi:hypothetical protein